MSSAQNPNIVAPQPRHGYTRREGVTSTLPTPPQDHLDDKLQGIPRSRNHVQIIQYWYIDTPGSAVKCTIPSLSSPASHSPAPSPERASDRRRRRRGDGGPESARAPRRQEVGSDAPSGGLPGRPSHAAVARTQIDDSRDARAPQAQSPGANEPIRPVPATDSEACHAHAAPAGRAKTGTGATHDRRRVPRVEDYIDSGSSATSASSPARPPSTPSSPFPSALSEQAPQPRKPRFVAPNSSQADLLRHTAATSTPPHKMSMKYTSNGELLYWHGGRGEYVPFAELQDPTGWGADGRRIGRDPPHWPSRPPRQASDASSTDSSAFEPRRTGPDAVQWVRDGFARGAFTDDFHIQSAALDARPPPNAIFDNGWWRPVPRRRLPTPPDDHPRQNETRPPSQPPVRPEPSRRHRQPEAASAPRRRPLPRPPSPLVEQNSRPNPPAQRQARTTPPTQVQVEAHTHAHAQGDGDSVPCPQCRFPAFHDPLCPLFIATRAWERQVHNAAQNPPDRAQNASPSTNRSARESIRGQSNQEDPRPRGRATPHPPPVIPPPPARNVEPNLGRRRPLARPEPAPVSVPVIPPPAEPAPAPESRTHRPRRAPTPEDSPPPVIPPPPENYRRNAYVVDVPVIPPGTYPGSPPTPPLSRPPSQEAGPAPVQFGPPRGLTPAQVQAMAAQQMQQIAMQHQQHQMAMQQQAFARGMHHAQGQPMPTPAAQAPNMIPNQQNPQINMSFMPQEWFPLPASEFDAQVAAFFASLSGGGPGAPAGCTPCRQHTGLPTPSTGQTGRSTMHRVSPYGGGPLLRPYLSPNPGNPESPSFLWDIRRDPCTARRVAARAVVVPAQDVFGDVATHPPIARANVEYGPVPAFLRASWGTMVVQSPNGEAGQITFGDVVDAIHAFFHTALTPPEAYRLRTEAPQDWARAVQAFAARVHSADALPPFEHGKGMRRIDVLGERYMFWGMWVTHNADRTFQFHLGTTARPKGILIPNRNTVRP